MASSLHCGIEKSSRPGFKQPWGRVAEQDKAHQAKRNVPDKNKCRRHSRGLFAAIAVKCQTIRPVGRRGWLRDNLQVSLPSVRCWPRDNGSARAAGSIISGGEKNGKQWSGPNLSDIILRVAVVTHFHQR